MTNEEHVAFIRGVLHGGPPDPKSCYLATIFVLGYLSGWIMKDKTEGWSSGMQIVHNAHNWLKFKEGDDGRPKH